MYAIKSGGKVVGYSDTVVYVRLHENGCYVPCDEAEAGGFSVETRVQYGGKLYRCVQAHTSQSDWTPPVAASLWSGVTVDPATGYDEWKQPTGAHDAYKKGDRVLFNGSVYESLIDGNAYSPTAYPAGWKLIE